MKKATFQPDRTLLAVVLVMTLGALPLALSAAWLAPALLLPVAVLVWVLRARVVATEEQLEVCNGLAVRRLRWDEVTGFRVPERGPVKLLRDGARPLPLTALTRRQLPELLAVSRTP